MYFIFTPPPQTPHTVLLTTPNCTPFAETHCGVFVGEQICSSIEGKENTKITGRQNKTFAENLNVLYMRELMKSVYCRICLRRVFEDL